jgi:hypothetical protein
VPEESHSNGLEASQYTLAGNVNARLTTLALTELAQAGIAAYSQLSPTDHSHQRIWVDYQSLVAATAVLRTQVNPMSILLELAPPSGSPPLPITTTKPSLISDLDDHFIPPSPPPVDRAEPITRYAWAAMLGGPSLLAVSAMSRWELPGLISAVAVFGFVGGFVTLIARMPHSPPPRDGPDDGAVV